ncbi:hypothetical protein ATANTOWER_018799, partial [Ataeniobius toweri]|nr:hypothetical protein [Ataeniobius toweri]
SLCCCSHSSTKGWHPITILSSQDVVQMSSTNRILVVLNDLLDEKQCIYTLSKTKAPDLSHSCQNYFRPDLAID